MLTLFSTALLCILWLLPKPCHCFVFFNSFGVCAWQQSVFMQWLNGFNRHLWCWAAAASPHANGSENTQQHFLKQTTLQDVFNCRQVEMFGVSCAPFRMGKLRLTDLLFWQMTAFLDMIHDHHNVTTHTGSNLIEGQRFKRCFEAFDFIMFSVARCKSGWDKKKHFNYLRFMACCWHSLHLMDELRCGKRH